MKRFWTRRRIAYRARSISFFAGVDQRYGDFASRKVTAAV
jgi:hypothetical protein